MGRFGERRHQQRWQDSPVSSSVPSWAVAGRTHCQENPPWGRPLTGHPTPSWMLAGSCSKVCQQGPLNPWLMHSRVAAWGWRSISYCLIWVSWHYWGCKYVKVQSGPQLLTGNSLALIYLTVFPRLHQQSLTATSSHLQWFWATFKAPVPLQQFNHRH